MQKNAANYFIFRKKRHILVVKLQRHVKKGASGFYLKTD